MGRTLPDYEDDQVRDLGVLCTGAKKGRYSIDDLKIYVARENRTVDRREGEIARGAVE